MIAMPRESTTVSFTIGNIPWITASSWVGYSRVCVTGCFRTNRDGSGEIDRAEFEVRSVQECCSQNNGNPAFCDCVSLCCTCLITFVQMAFYAVDPVSGNSLGFQPSLLLHPRDAYEVRGRTSVDVTPGARGRPGLRCGLVVLVSIGRYVGTACQLHSKT